jgi:hypothetical protein
MSVRLATARGPAQFVRTTHSADDLENIESFLHAVMKAKATPKVTA